MTDQDKNEPLEIPVDPADGALAPVEIVIDGDKAEVQAAQPADKGRDGDIPAEEGIANLKQQLADERARRSEAERVARENEEKLSQANRVAGDSQYQALISNLETAKNEVEAAQEAVIAAQEAGDYRKAAELTRNMVRLENRLQYLENVKSNVETRRAQAEQPGRVVDNPGSQLDHITSQLTPKSAAWVKQHPDVVSKWNKVLAAHNAAVELKSLEAESPEYFEYVESELGIKKADDAQPAPKPRETVVPAAPASRDTPSLSSGKSTRQTIVLTAEEREMAAIEGMTDVEYARQKAAAMNEGLIGRRLN